MSFGIDCNEIEISCLSFDKLTQFMIAQISPITNVPSSFYIYTYCPMDTNQHQITVQRCQCLRRLFLCCNQLEWQKPSVKAAAFNQRQETERKLISPSLCRMTSDELDKLEIIKFAYANYHLFYWRVVNNSLIIIYNYCTRI